MTRLRYLFLFLVGILLFAFMTIVASSMHSPFYFFKAVKLNVNYIMPQGWAFFTRNAREERIIIYEIKDGKISPERVNIPGSSYKYLFGLDRRGRKLAMEYMPLLAKIDSSKWTSCKFNTKEILKLSNQQKAVIVKNKTKVPRCCAELIFIKTEIIPWAYSKYENIEMPAKFIKIYAVCPKTN